jgi:C4-dicarboxylate transporter DctM subunit
MGWVMVLVPIGLLVLGFPIFLVLLATVMVLLLGFMDLPLTVVPQIMFGSIDKFSLLAVPFFIFAGELMGRGGISKRIVDWVLTIFGGVRGSLGLTTVGTCEFFGAISGSSPATVAAVGRLLYPSLRESGYDEKFSVGLVTSSGAIASVIPPSIIMILYGASAEQSVALLFVAGFIPGLLIGLLMSIYIVFYARRHNLREGQAFRWSPFLKATGNGIWALGTPIVILGGIYTGVFTPTEAAGVAGIYGIFVTRLIYRDISWKGLWTVAVNSVFLTAQIMIIVAASGVFSWLLTVSGIPQTIVGFIREIQAQPWVIVLAMNLFLLIVGCLIDPTSAILILTPLLLPIARNIGLDLIHFGIIMTVNLSMGMFTPPFGLNIFVSQALFHVPLSRIFLGIIPFFLIQLIALGIITFIPELSLYLTRFVH